MAVLARQIGRANFKWIWAGEKIHDCEDLGENQEWISLSNQDIGSKSEQIPSRRPELNAATAKYKK